MQRQLVGLVGYRFGFGGVPGTRREQAAPQGEVARSSVANSLLASGELAEILCDSCLIAIGRSLPHQPAELWLNSEARGSLPGIRDMALHLPHTW